MLKKRPLNIAVIGAGFAGLAVSWHLLRSGCRVELYDKRPIGKGTSGIAAGLLHPYSRSFKTHRVLGLEGLKASLDLIRHVEKEKNVQLITEGLLRFPVAPTGCFFSEIPSCSFYSDGYTVDAPRYIENLFACCLELGLVFHQKEILDPESLEDADYIVVAAGFESGRVEGLSTLPLKMLKGQVAEVVLRASLPYSLTGPVYLAKNDGKVLMGATFERGSDSLDTDFSQFEKELRPKWESLDIGLWEDLKISGLKAGVRAGTPDRMPIMRSVTDRLWTLTGFGSKGLLYHALFAEKLAKALMEKV